MTAKERLHSVKKSNFEIAAIFHHLYGERKSAAISKIELFLTQRIRPYIVFALDDHSISLIPSSASWLLPNANYASA